MDLTTAIHLVIADVRTNYDGAADATVHAALDIAKSELASAEIASALTRGVINQQTADAYHVMWAADWDELVAARWSA